MANLNCKQPNSDRTSLRSTSAESSSTTAAPRTNPLVYRSTMKPHFPRPAQTRSQPCCRENQEPSDSESQTTEEHHTHRVDAAAEILGTGMKSMVAVRFVTGESTK